MAKKRKNSRARLLQAATQRFARHGLAGARIGDIVADAGLTQAAFYLYFKGKKALYDQLLSDFHHGLSELVDQLPSSPDPEILHRTLTATFNYMARDPELTRLAMADVETGEKMRRRLARGLAEHLETIASQGLLHPDLDRELVAEAIVGMVERLSARFSLTAERTPEQVTDGIFKFLYQGLHPTQHGGN